MPYSPEDSLALLERTPAALNALLRGLPATWTQRNEGDNTWTVFDVLGHLVHGERTDWMQRAEIILNFGETRPFDPFDREAMFRESHGKSLDDLLDEFAHLRAENLRRLCSLHLRPADLERQGRHPIFGTVTLQNLLATWAVHDLTHLHQISRVMAHQHRNAVGPWQPFLGVLKCNGHSS